MKNFFTVNNVWTTVAWAWALMSLYIVGLHAYLFTEQPYGSAAVLTGVLCGVSVGALIGLAVTRRFIKKLNQQRAEVDKKFAFVKMRIMPLQKKVEECFNRFMEKCMNGEPEEAEKERKAMKNMQSLIDAIVDEHLDLDNEAKGN